MKIQYLGFIPAIIFIVFVTNKLSGGDDENWETLFMIIGTTVFSALIICGLIWALS